MAHLGFHDDVGPLDPRILAVKEAELGFRLPDGYRRFLLEERNGAHVVLPPRPEDFGSGLEVIYGVERDDDFDLDRHLETYTDRIHPGFFPTTPRSRTDRRGALSGSIQ